MNGLMSCDEKNRKIPQHDNKVTCKKLTKPFQCPFSPHSPTVMNCAPFATDYRLFVSSSSSPPTNASSTTAAAPTGHCLDIATKSSPFNDYLQSTLQQQQQQSQQPQQPIRGDICTSNTDRYYSSKESVNDHNIKPEKDPLTKNPPSSSAVSVSQLPIHISPPLAAELGTLRLAF